MISSTCYGPYNPLFSTEGWANTPHCDYAELAGTHIFYVCVCVCTTLCVSLCVLYFFPHNFGMRSKRKRTDFHLSGSFAKKKKKIPSYDSNICFSHLSLALPLSLSSIFSSLSKWHLWMTRALRVSGAEGRNRGGGGRGEREIERERGSKRLSLHISPAPPQRASQPAVCSPLSFLFYHSTGKKKKSIHISIIHTPVCLHVFACPPPPSPFLSPSLSASPLG